MKHIGNLLWFTLCLHLGLPASAAEPLAVVSPGAVLPRVVAADGQVDQDAAADLCEYLSQVTGRQIEPGAGGTGANLTIHVGADAFTLEHAPGVRALRSDGYFIKHLSVNGQDHLILSGIRGAASRWAVEQFLQDHCGVRWLFPGSPYGQIVPSRSTVSLPNGIDQTYEPDFLHRANCAMYYFDRARKYLRLRPQGFAFGGHALQFIFDGQDYEAHPEWFAFFDGKRQWWSYGNGWQICLTNPEALARAIQYARDYLDKNPDSPIVSMGHNDGHGWCECEACRAFAASVDPPYSISEQWWHWINKVAQGVAQTHPGRLVSALGYGAPATPPRFQLEPNVAVTVTVYLARHVDLAEQWRKVCKSVNIYSYAYGASFLGFRHYPHAMRDFLKWGRDDLGAIAHVTECGGDWTFDGPKYHYIQALQWDADADPNLIMIRYCADAYGTAAAPMKQFWDRLEQIYERREPRRRLLFYQWVSWHVRVAPNEEFEHYTLNDVAFLDTRINEALELAADEAERFRVQRVADGWRYVRTMHLAKLKYFDHQQQVIHQAQGSKDLALETAKDIAELRAQREQYMTRLRTYRAINPRLARKNFWSWGEAITVFSAERMLLDECCTIVTQKLREAKGDSAAVGFWEKVDRDDPLYASAQSQVYLINAGEQNDLLANGDFESGRLDEWQVAGTAVVDLGARGGKFAAQAGGDGPAEISQRVTVAPMERYRLTAWCRYVSTPAPDALPLEAEVVFFGGKADAEHIRKYGPKAAGGIRIWSEPTRCMVDTGEGSAGWLRLGTTVTVPPGADSATISLKKRSAGTTLWDDVSFERIRNGPATRPGQFHEDFAGPHLDDGKWFQATYGGLGAMPRARDGWLRFDDKPMTTLVALGTFDDLLEHRGQQRYCLRLHVAPLKEVTEDASFEWGIRTGTGTISIKGTGFYWTHTFATAPGAKSTLHTHAHQDSQRTTAPVAQVADGTAEGRQVWYSLYFDPQHLWIYAATDGYDDSADSLVGKYAHQITTIGGNGAVYLKLSGRGVKLNEISLSGGPVRSAAGDG